MQANIKFQNKEATRNKEEVLVYNDEALEDNPIRTSVENDQQQVGLHFAAAEDVATTAVPHPAMSSNKKRKGSQKGKVSSYLSLRTSRFLTEKAREIRVFVKGKIKRRYDEHTYVPLSQGSVHYALASQYGKQCMVIIQLLF